MLSQPLIIFSIVPCSKAKDVLVNNKINGFILIEILIYENKFCKLNAYTPNYNFVLSTN